MKNLFKLLSVFLLFAAFTQAQFHMSVGPALGMNFNIHTGSDLDESGNGFGIAFAGRIDMSFDRAKMFGIITGLTFYDGRGGSTSTTGTEQGVSYTQDVDISLSYFQIEALFRLRLPAGVYFLMGPELGFNLSGESETTTQITTPGVTFQGGSTTSRSKATIKDTNARFELKIGAGYDIPLSQLITLTPELSFGLGLTKVIKNVSYNVHTIQALVTCKFNVL